MESDGLIPGCRGLALREARHDGTVVAGFARSRPRALRVYAGPLVRVRINRHRSGWTLPSFISLDEAHRRDTLLAEASCRMNRRGLSVRGRARKAVFEN